MNIRNRLNRAIGKDFDEPQTQPIRGNLSLSLTEANGLDQSRSSVFLYWMISKSGWSRMSAGYRKTAKAVRNAVTESLTPYKDRVHTITYDNGREFADHEGMANDLDACIYFAHPYASWERELNENTNGLTRQYFPKDRDLTTVTKHEIKQATDKLDHRPRISLGYRTPMKSSSIPGLR